jgi:hypothetical protein
MKTGVNMSAMQVANMAAAASSRPPKTSKRSHRLTAGICQHSPETIWSISVCVFAGLKRSTQELPSVTRRLVVGNMAW